MKNIIKDIKYFIVTRVFVLTLFLSLTLSIFFVYLCRSDNVNLLKNYLFNISNSWFIFSLLFMCLILSNKIFNDIKSNVNYLVRFNNKISAYRYSLKIITIINTIIMFICYIVPFLLLIFENKLSFILSDYYVGVNYLIYNIYYVIRNILVVDILILLYFIIKILFNSKVSLVVYLCNLISIVLIPDNSDVIYGINNIRLLPKYYLSPVMYSSFVLEVSMSTLYISILFIIYYLLLYIYSKSNKDII